VAAQRIHQRIVAIAAIAGPEDVLDQRFQSLITEPGVDVRDKFFFLSRANIEELRSSPGLFEDGEVFVDVGLGGIVEDHHLDGMSIPPEVLIIFVDRSSDIA
jgi:hypothetical protein